MISSRYFRNSRPRLVRRGSRVVLAGSGTVAMAVTRYPIDAVGRNTARSLDHLVGAHQQRLRNRGPERFGSLEIDHELELRRLLHRHAGWLGTLENARDVVGDSIL